MLVSAYVHSGNWHDSVEVFVGLFFGTVYNTSFVNWPFFQRFRFRILVSFVPRG